MKLYNLRGWRTLVPGAAFVFTAVLLARLTYPLPAEADWLLWYARLDPLLFLNTWRWEGALPAWSWLPLTVMAVTLLGGRLFCGWLCPVGGVLAILHRLQDGRLRLSSYRRSSRQRPKWTEHLYQIRYIWLALVLAVLFLGNGLGMYLSPFHLLTEELTRLWQQQIPWLLLTVLLSGLLIFPRFWCVFVCPSGLLLSLLARWRRLAVKPAAGCLECGLCENICPMGAATAAAGTFGADCLVCGRCSEICPVGNCQLGTAGYIAAGSSGFTRREVLRAGAALAAAGAALPALQVSAAEPVLRPPGALPEAEFLARCSRCGRCIKVCPSNCLKAMPLTTSSAGFLTPMIIPRQARCELTQLCQSVCPTGALTKLSVDKTLIGMAKIDRSRCIGWAEGRLCLLCQEQCPRNAIDSDAEDRPSIVEELCTGCGACENGCPLEPAAVVVVPQPQRRRP